MNMFNDEMADEELSEMLAAWVVTAPSEELRARVLTQQIFGAFQSGSGVWGSMVSLGAHVALVLLALVVFQNPEVQKKVRHVTSIYLPVVIHEQKTGESKGGGGGGQRAAMAVSHGAAPKLAARQFIPPAAAVPKPMLPTVPTISAAAPIISAENYGDPLSKLAGNSAGPGLNGLGKGGGGGLGDGWGTGIGDGSGGGVGGGAFRAGGDVSSPVLISKVEPEYSEEARRAKYSGTVLLSVIVDERGVARDIRVVRPLGLGLDERAIQAVQQWRFRPGIRNGKAVRVQATVEVSFRLL